MQLLTDWIITVGRIGISPIPKTFQEEAVKAKGKTASAIVVIALAQTTGYLVAYPLLGADIHLFVLVGGLFLYPITFLFFVFCLHVLYKKLFNRKKEHYEELLYLITALYLPFIIINTAGEIWANQIVIWASWGIFLFLIGVILKTITKLNVWQTALVVFLGAILAFAGLYCIPFFSSVL